MWLILFYGNNDENGKNFAFIFDEKLDGYKLSPFYDITRTPEKAEHEMTAAGSGNPTEKDLLEVARQTALDIEKCKKIIANVREALNNWTIKGDYTDDTLPYETDFWTLQSYSARTDEVAR